ncbi:MAG: purple acid phosphatase [Actinomycetota bacterium]|nr:purple acid phosphatase [Actinomycetota bacterium]
MAKKVSLLRRGRRTFRLARRGTNAAVEASSVFARSLVFGRAEPSARDQYVQNISSRSAVIAWMSEEPGAGFVEYGETPELGHERGDGRTGKRHAVTLSGLRPGSRYYYRVAGAQKTASFRTAPEGPGSCFTFAVVGDSGTGSKAQRAVAGLLERMRPDLILHTGDVVYPKGDDADYDPKFFEPYRRIIESVPVYPSLGNHDVETKNGAPYLNNFYLPHDDPESTGRYYSFDWGNAHFVALDSELYYDDDGDDPERQKVWLERDLSQTRQPWKFVFFHRPPYSSSEHGSDLVVREDLEPVLARHGVNLVFSGHDHDYERTVQIMGVTYVVTGGGGKDLYEAGESEWTAFSRSTHHAVRVRVDGDRLRLEAVVPNGAVVDRLDLCLDRNEMTG